MTTGTLKDKVYNSVIQSIINGVYTVDSVLSEKSLAEKLEVSKAPVREALIALCSEGVLESIPRTGYRVVRYTDQNIRDILEYRTLLECGCLEKSFDLITTTQIRHLESILESELLFLSNADPRDYWSKTLNFHLTLASFAENEYIFNRLDTALNSTMRAYLQLYWSQWKERAFPEPSSLHVQIVDAIAHRSKDKAIALLRMDVNTLYSET